MNNVGPTDQVEILHNRAMELCDRAIKARAIGDGPGAEVLFRSAFEAEDQAASLIADRPEFEPTRSILHRSAATLALDCQDDRAAERLVTVGLAGNPPDEIALELRAILARVQSARRPRRPGTRARVD